MLSFFISIQGLNNFKVKVVLTAFSSVQFTLNVLDGAFIFAIYYDFSAKNHFAKMRNLR